MEITLYHYLFLALFIFFIGFIISLTSSHVIKVLISFEFMLIGININFLAFNSYYSNLNADGYIFVLFCSAIKSAEIVIALYLFHIMYSKKTYQNIEDYRVL